MTLGEMAVRDIGGAALPLLTDHLPNKVPTVRMVLLSADLLITHFTLLIENITSIKGPGGTQLQGLLPMFRSIKNRIQFCES